MVAFAKRFNIHYIVAQLGKIFCEEKERKVNMKKLICLLLASLMALSLVGCGDEEKNEKDNKDNKNNKDFKVESILGEWASSPDECISPDYVFCEWGYVYTYLNGEYKKMKYEIEGDKLVFNYKEKEKSVLYAGVTKIKDMTEEVTYEIQGDVLILNTEDNYNEYYKIDNSEKTAEEKQIIERDKELCSDIERRFRAAMNNEKAFEEVMVDRGVLIITVKDGELEFECEREMPKLEAELKHSLDDLEAPSEKGKTSYRISWTIDGKMYSRPIVVTI